MEKYLDKDIDILQKNLKLIRTTGKWTAEEFGEMIGVTKQTIRNIETNTTKLSKTQYIAIRSVLDYEISLKRNDKLETVINLLFNSEEMSDNDKEKALAFISGAVEQNLDKESFNAGLAALIGGVAAVTVTVAVWLAKIMKK